MQSKEPAILLPEATAAWFEHSKPFRFVIRRRLRRHSKKRAWSTERVRTRATGIIEYRHPPVPCLCQVEAGRWRAYSHQPSNWQDFAVHCATGPRAEFSPKENGSLRA